MKFPRRITAFGSSSIHGTNDFELGGFINRFRLWHEAQNEKNRVYNLGIWGESCESLIARIPSEAEVRKPHLIIIYPGLNDICRVGSSESLSLVDYHKVSMNIEKLIASAEQIAPVLILTAYPFDQNKTQPLKGTQCHYLFEDAQRYTEILVEICRKRKVPMLDLFNLLKERDLSAYWGKDGLHFNSLGHKILFEELKTYFVANFSSCE